MALRPSRGAGALRRRGDQRFFLLPLPELFDEPLEPELFDLDPLAFELEPDDFGLEADDLEPPPDPPERALPELVDLPAGGADER